MYDDRAFERRRRGEVACSAPPRLVRHVVVNHFLANKIPGEELQSKAKWDVCLRALAPLGKNFELTQLVVDCLNGEKVGVFFDGRKHAAWV
jgi:hypothetical protein